MISRLLLPAVAAGLLAFAPAQAALFSKKPSQPKHLEVRTTAYTHTESDHVQYGRKTALGTRLKYGKSYSSAAADWSKFPVGTKFKIDGMPATFVIDDYGSALVGTETIDIYQPSRSAMNKWGVRHVDIKILEYGDFEKSREILEQRTKYSHCRKMLASIKKNPGPKKQKPKAPADRPAPALETPAPAPAPQIEREPAMALAEASTEPRSEPLAGTPPAAASDPEPAPTATPETSASSPEPAPRVREFQPIEIASAPAEAVARPEPAESTAIPKPRAAAGQPAPRKHEVRPISLAANL